MADPNYYDCGADKQAIKHIVSECTKKKFHRIFTEINTETNK